MKRANKKTGNQRTKVHTSSIYRRSKSNMCPFWIFSFQYNFWGARMWDANSIVSAFGYFFQFFLNHEQCDAMRWALHSSKNWLNATITIPINCCNSLYAPTIITLSLNAIISTLQLSIWTNHKNLNTQFTNATFICSLLLTQTTVW